MPVSPYGATVDVPLSIGSDAAVAAATTTYIGPVGNQPAANQAAFVIPYPGSIRLGYFNVSVAPGAGLTTTFTVYKNGVATALTAGITGASATSAQDLVHGVPVQPGDQICVQVVTPTGGAAAFCFGCVTLTA
jgi:hypothetical protein